MRPRRPRTKSPSSVDGARWLARALKKVGAAALHHGGCHKYARTIGPHRTRLRLAGPALPGTYQFIHHSGKRGFDRDAAETVTFAHVERIA